MPQPCHKPLLEVCVDSVDSILSAISGGADRLELCAALSEGGLTPSLGLVHSGIRLARGMSIHVMIRPRMGDFLYTPEEQALMLCDIEALIGLPIDGFVIGALRSDGQLDLDFLRRVATLVNGRKSLNCHRAIDVCADRDQAIQQLISLGFARVLTSGGANTAAEATEELARLIRTYGQDIIIMPGAGISPSNIQVLWQKTGAQEFHLSAKQATTSQMQYRHTGVSMGGDRADEYTRYTTSSDILNATRQALDRD